jgi:hypothetical protein
MARTNGLFSFILIFTEKYIPILIDFSSMTLTEVLACLFDPDDFFRYVWGLTFHVNLSLY